MHVEQIIQLRGHQVEPGSPGTPTMRRKRTSSLLSEDGDEYDMVGDGHYSNRTTASNVNIAMDEVRLWIELS